MDEVGNFVNADKGVPHSSIMAALILKEQLQKLYRREVGVEDVEGLDDDHAGIDTLNFYDN
jgi:hypothetical protein